MVDQEVILKLAYEIRDDIFDSSTSISSIVRKYYTFQQYSDEISDIIKGELLGFTNINYLPNYRKIKWKRDRISSELYTYEIKDPISSLERYLNSGRNITVRDDRYSWNTYTITLNNIYYIIEGVKNIILSGINQKIIEIEYSDIHYEIFNDTKKFVDNKLLEINSKVLKDLTTSYQNLKDVSDTNSASKIAFSCRQILEDFSDSIYKDEFLPTGNEKPKKNQIKNKIRFTLANTSSKSNKKIIQSQVDYLSKLIDFIQKNIHPKNYQLHKEDANRCIIYTYLIIGDILKILEFG